MKRLRIVLDKILDDKHITRYQLAKQTNINYYTIDRYYKNKSTKLDLKNIFQICISLNCQPGDIIKIIDE